MPRGPAIEDFAEKLRLALGRANLSRAQLAQQAGVDKSVVARWASGVLHPSDHTLSALSAVLGRHVEGFTRMAWDLGPAAFAAHLGLPAEPPPPQAAPIGGFGFHGLRLVREPALEGPFLGLWVGFGQSIRYRGIIALYAVHIGVEPAGLRCHFTEGRVIGEGPAFAGSARLQCFVELAPIPDRICSLLFNGVLERDQIVLDGLYMGAATDAAQTPAAAPILLFYLGDATAYASLGGLEGTRDRIGTINYTRDPEGGDPIPAILGLLPPRVMELLQPLIGVAREDGEFDHVLRMPAVRAQTALGVVGPDGVSIAHRVQASLRGLLGLA